MRRFHSACNGCILVSSPDSDFLYLRYTFANSARALSSGHMAAQLDDPRNIQSAISFTSTFSKLPLTFSLGGGMGTSRNRTTWPIGGGALAVQPGWFQGHSKGFFYVNMGFGTNGPDNGPNNFTNVMVPIFEFTGPSNGPYPGTFCLPQIPLPANATVKAGDLATIQVVMTAQHGASLFNVSCYV